MTDQPLNPTPKQPDPSPERGEQRWTIWVCPNCGKRQGGPYFCRCVIPSSRCAAVEVAPVSLLQEARREGDTLREAVLEAIAPNERGDMALHHGQLLALRDLALSSTQGDEGDG